MFKQTADAITLEPIEVKIDVTERIKWMPWKKRTVNKSFSIQPLKLGSMVRISKLLLEIDPKLFDMKDSMYNIHHELVSRYARKLVEVIAVAFTNAKEQPPKSLMDMIEFNITPADLMRIFSAVIQQSDISNFMSSIISIRGINILKEMNPMEQRSQIASGEQSED